MSTTQRLGLSAAVLIGICIVLVSVFPPATHEQEPESADVTKSRATPFADFEADHMAGVRQPLPAPAQTGPESPSGLPILIVDEDGRVVPGAEAWATSHGSQSSVRTVTDESGHAILPVPDGAYTLVAREGARESRPTSVDWHSDMAGHAPVTLTLQPCSITRGRVVTRDGLPVPDAQVVLLGASASFGRVKMAQAWRSGTWPGPCTTSGDDGFFELAVPEGSAGSLLAGAPGLAMERPVPLAAGNPEVVLVLDRLYAVATRFEVPLSNESWNWGLFAGGVGFELPHEQIHPDQRSVVLGGIEPELAFGGPWPRLTIYTLSREDLTARSAVVKGTFPGFDSFRVEVPIQGADHMTSVNVVKLHDRAVGRGDLTIVIDGLPDAGSSLPAREVWRCELLLTSDKGESWFAPVWSPYAEELVIRGVPAGRYGATLAVDGERIAGRPRIVDIAPEARGAVSFSCGHFASVEFDFRDNEGRPLTSPVTIGLKNGDGFTVEHRFTGPPYFLDFLSAGRYDLTYWTPQGRGPLSTLVTGPGHQRTPPLFPR